MATFATSDRVIGIGMALFIGLLCVVSAQALANTENLTGIALTIGLLVLLVSFTWPEIGLYILILSMLLGPELIVSDLAGGTATVQRGVTLRVDDFLILIIAFAWLARGAVNKELGLFLSTPLNRPIATYLLIAITSTAFGMLLDRVSPIAGFFFVLKYVEYIFVYFAVVNFIQDKEQVYRLVRVLFITGILVAILALIQIPQGGRVTAPFEGQTGEPNTLGGYLIILIALFAGLIVTSDKLSIRLSNGFGVLLLGIPFLYTLSRASYLGILATGIVIIWLSRQKLIASFAAITFILAILLLAPPSVRERVAYTFGGQAAHSSQVVIGDVRLDTSTSARLNSFSEILSDFSEHPILGYGVTGYRFVDGQYFRVLIEMGLLGLVAFLWLLGALVKQGRQALTTARGSWERGICIGFLAGLAGLAFHALASNTFTIVRIMEPFWFLAGIITVLHTLNTTEHEEEKKPEDQEEDRPVTRGLISPLSGRSM